MAVPALPNTRKPDIGAYFTQSGTVLDHLLAHSLPTDVLMHSFHMETKMFFVDHARLRYSLNGAIALIQKQAVAHFSAPSAPSRKELDRLRFGEALSLFSVVRMHECFIGLCKANATCASTIKAAGLERGFDAKSVMPSVLRFNRSRYQDTLAKYGLSSSAVPDLLADDKVDKAELLIRELAEGYQGQNGVRVGAYRATQKLAEKISKAISGATGGAMTPDQVLAHVFDPDPTRGPGHGAACRRRSSVSRDSRGSCPRDRSHASLAISAGLKCPKRHKIRNCETPTIHL